MIHRTAQKAGVNITKTRPVMRRAKHFFPILHAHLSLLAMQCYKQEQLQWQDSRAEVQLQSYAGRSDASSKPRQHS